MARHLTAVVAFAALALSLPVWAQPTPSPELTSRLEEAIRLLEGGRAPEARPRLEAVIADARAVDDKATEGHALGRLGRALQLLGDHAGAAVRFSEAERVLTEVGDLYPLGLLLNARAQFFYARGDAPAAEADWRRALELFERSGKPRDEARALYSLTFVRRQDPAEVVALLERAFSLARAATAPDVEGLVLQRWCDELVLSGDYGAALEKIRAAVATLERTGQPAQIARALTSLGRVHRLHGDYDGALTAFERALALHRTTNDASGIGQSMNAVAVALRVLGRTAEAIATARSAVDYLDQHDDRTGTLALTCQTLATALEDDGKLDEALHAVDRGLAAAPRPTDRPLLLATRASLLSALGRAEDAEAALAEAESLSAPRQDIGGLLLGTKADLRARAGHLDEALDASAALLRAYEEQRSRAAPVDGLKAGFDNVRQWAWAQRVRLLADAGRHGEALEATEGARARAFADLLAARRLDTVQPRVSTDVASDQRPVLSSTEPSGARPLTRGRESEAAWLASPVVVAPPHLSEIAAHAERLGSIVLAYWVERDAVRIWTVDGEARVHHAVVRADARRLVRLVRATWSTNGARAVSAGAPAGVAPSAPTRALRELYELLIAPVAQALPRSGARRLTIVPHGPLFRLSFAALRSTSGRYLLEDFEIHYTPSIGVLAATEAVSRHAAASGVLVVAAPRLGKDLQLEGLDALPGAEIEGRAVASLSGARGDEVLTGASATESVARRLVSHRRVLHFATHAMISDDHPLDSFLALADERATTGGESDGRLTVEEVYGLRLDADLVVLSACRSAAGRVTGDGLGGLVRAFVYAGTPSIVAAAWDLPDVSAAFALPRFYRERARGVGKAAALRAAQLSLLRAVRGGRLTVDTPAGRFALPDTPAYWAGLVLIGEP